MKQKYVPIEKQSKKRQKEFHATQRKTWGSMCPVTRKVPNLKAYNRNKSKFRYESHEPNLDFLFIRQYIRQFAANFLTRYKRIHTQSTFRLRLFKLSGVISTHTFFPAA